MPASTRPQRPGALRGRGLADRLDRQPLHLGAHRVARDAGDAGVHDVPDARHGQRGLGDVGGQHDAATGVRGEDLVLLGGREPGVERHDLERQAAALRAGRGRASASAVSRISRSPGQEDQDVAGPLGGELLHRVDDRLGLVADDGLALLILLGELHQRSVADLDGVGPPGDLDDRRGRAVRLREVLGEALRVDGGRGDDQLEVGPARQQPAQVAEQEVDVEAALVRLVDDDRVVLREHPVALELGQQDAVGHQLDPAGLRGPVGEAHLVADQVAELGAQLGGDPLGDRAGRDPARLGVPDQPAALAPAAAAELEADLGDLGGLARPGLAGDDDDLVVADGGGDVVAALGDRQLGRVGDHRGTGCGAGHDVGHSARAAVSGANQFPGRPQSVHRKRTGRLGSDDPHGADQSRRVPPARARRRRRGQPRRADLDGAALRGLAGARRPTPASKAVAAAKEFRPDAVVLDMMLPDFDGLEVLRRMRGTDPDVPVVFLTARDAVEDRVAGLTAGGDDYVTKPFSLEEVVARLRGLMRRSGARQAATSSVLTVGDLEPRRGQPRGPPRRRRDQPDRDRVRAAALPDAQPAPGAVARRRSWTGSGTTTSAARPTSSSSTSPTCARRSTPGASR